MNKEEVRINSEEMKRALLKMVANSDAPPGLPYREQIYWEEIKRLNKLLKEYGNHKINCQCAIQMLMAESFECTCGFREALKDK